MSHFYYFCAQNYLYKYMDIAIENHPFEPFVPIDAKILMLGTFPPKAEKWSMNFFYPNWINDMWRIMGIVFYDDPQHFVKANEKAFNLEMIKQFLCQTGIALFDTAQRVRRLKDNASDKFLDIVERVDLEGILTAHPTITAVVTTGEKAATVVAEITGSELPKMGESCMVEFCGKMLTHYRMPSSSRAYPMNIRKKAEFYRSMLVKNDIHL